MAEIVELSLAKTIVEAGQPASEPTSQLAPFLAACGEVEPHHPYSERVRQILLAQPLNPLVKLKFSVIV